MTMIVSKIEDWLASQGKRFPAHVNRASEIGHECERFLVYRRTRWQDEILPDAKLQAVFMIGNILEEFAFDLMRKAGLPVIEQQVMIEDKRMKVTGHADATSAFEPDDPFVVEIKTAHPMIWNQINTVDDLKKKPWLKKYPAQVQLYMFIRGYRRGVILFVNKSTGWLKEIWMDLDLDFVAEIEDKCKRINFAVEVSELAKTDEEKEACLPARITDRATCGMCSFRHVCLPDVNFEAELKIADDPEFEAKLKRVVAAKPLTAEMTALEKEVKSRIKATAEAEKLESIRISAGNVLISGKKDAKGAWRIAFEGEEE
ncbi:MAG: hypothetical protein AAB538_01685 [Patescibacteria group bacterium]